ncbi:Metallophosphoesterase [Carbonactinospora thermoautotrophica]|uniref:Metallophosphoesterase n=1 Tax=Carbonactinospora thermoautotrophica TaxID=1469144 RepID=A0A132ML07_9ACTN|nr:metallophosphoesterase [Carbonactinospora thermoautotrophica]KWW98557.1 Metallophosphoesterase [Carbonactinospora thermoautotrophica]
MLARVQNATTVIRAAVARFLARRAVKMAGVVLVALCGLWIGLMLGARVDARIGPMDTHLSLRPTLEGDTFVNVSPVGSLQLDSHDGPIGLRVDMVQLDPKLTQALIDDPNRLRGLDDQIPRDVRQAIVRLLIRGAVSAVLVAAALTWLVTRRARHTLVAGSTALVVLAAGGGAVAATWNPKSLLEPRYHGLLASAPSIVVSAQNLITDFETYRKELAKLVTNVSRLYTVTSKLPTYQPDPSTIRVLHVSDLHLNPMAWSVIESLVQQFGVTFIIDSGDLTDRGTSAENQFASHISRLGRPYVFVRGNHDSPDTAAAVARQKGAIVLRGRIVTVEGLRILGDADPRWPPDRPNSQEPPAAPVQQMVERLARTARDASPPVDIVVTHDPTYAAPLGGVTPTVLTGHAHRREVRALEHGTRLFVQGSTGGAGMRGLNNPQPVPIQCSVLYFDRKTKRLQAWDDITVGGLGLASVEVSRHLADEATLTEKTQLTPSPTATESPG